MHDVTSLSSQAEEENEASQGQDLSRCPAPRTPQLLLASLTGKGPSLHPTYARTRHTHTLTHIHTHITQSELQSKGKRGHPLSCTICIYQARGPTLPKQQQQQQQPFVLHPRLRTALAAATMSSRSHTSIHVMGLQQPLGTKQAAWASHCVALIRAPVRALMASASKGPRPPTRHRSCAPWGSHRQTSAYFPALNPMQSPCP